MEGWEIVHDAWTRWGLGKAVAALLISTLLLSGCGTIAPRYVDGKPTLFEQASSGDGKIADAKIPPAAAGQQFAVVRVQVGPVTLQGERQIRYQ